jgi:multicomponent Na+:H+ antiporter subunit C
VIVANAIGAVVLFSMGAYCVLTRRNIVKIVMGLSLMESSTYLLLVSFAWRRGGTAPILDQPPKGRTVADLAHGPIADPFLQNICLTAIVIGVAVTGVFLAVCVRIAQHYRTADTERLRTLHG